MSLPANTPFSLADSRVETSEPEAQQLRREIEAQFVFTDRERRSTRAPLVRLERGIFFPRDLWATLTPERWHLARVIAAGRVLSPEAVFSHESAAVLHRLPLFGAKPRPVHLTGPAHAASRNRPGLVRHRRDLAPEDLVSIAGLRCTSLERTLLDLARFADSETAIACVETTLRQRFRVRRDVDRERLNEWRTEVLETLQRLPRERGSARARFIVGIADPRTDSVLESVSHLYLRRCGFRLELQSEVVVPGQGRNFLDFELLGLGIFGECDGRVKYFDERMLAGRTAAEVLYREKRRQQVIEGLTGKRVLRWGWQEIGSELAFAQMLDAYGVPIPRPPQGLVPRHAGERVPRG